MTAVSPIPAIVVTLVALVTCAVITRFFGEPNVEGRQTSIDGLRGYLALSVFLHHSCVWYFYIQTETWSLPPSRLYSHLGQTTVALFFMITGFLFVSKLLDNDVRPVDWGKLFVSRVLRITPLYLVAVSLVFLIVTILTRNTLQQPKPELLWGCMKWLGFTIFGNDDLNGVKDTRLIVADVTWSLCYEWFFYCSLPLIGLTMRIRARWPYLALGIVNLLIIWKSNTEIDHWYPFFGGIFAAYLVRFGVWKNNSTKPIFGLVAGGCLSVSVASFASGYSPYSLALVSLAFAIIAGGNTLGGILSHPVSRTLGEMSYSIYLLHGIFLFVTFKMWIDQKWLNSLSAWGYWSIVVGIVPLLITVCYATFRFIERPPMQYVTPVTNWIRLHLVKPDRKNISFVDDRRYLRTKRKSPIRRFCD